MFAVVAGAGDVGRTVARALRADGHDVVVVEHDPRALERARDLDVLVIEGNAASPRIQEQASVGKADLLFALTGADEVNLMACALAKMKGVPTLCRITSLDFVDLPSGSAYRAVGADTTVSLEFAAALKLTRILETNRLRNLDLCAQGRFQIVELLVEGESQAVGREIGAVPLGVDSRAVGVIRDNAFQIARLSESLRAEDRLIVLTRNLNALGTVESLFGKRGSEGSVPERIMILGASTTGIHLARLLVERGKKVTVIDEDPVRVGRATSILPGAVIVEGKPTDRQLLVSEGAEHADIVVGATGAEEVNILACLIAKQLGKARAIALLNQPELRFPVQAMGIELAIAPRVDGIAPVLIKAHALSNILSDFHLLHGGEGQTLVIEVTSKSRLVGRTVHKAGLPDGAMIGAILHASEPRIARPDDVMRAGDRVVIVSEAKVVPDLKKLV